MSTILPTAHTNDSRAYGLFDIETWKEIAKSIAKIAVFAILPVASYLASGAIAFIAVLSLETFCYLGYQILSKAAEIGNEVLSQVVGAVATGANIAYHVGTPIASYRN